MKQKSKASLLAMLASSQLSHLARAQDGELSEECEQSEDGGIYISYPDQWTAFKPKKTQEINDGQVANASQYSLKGSHYFYSDREALVRFATIVVDIEGPTLQDGACIWWYAQIEDP